MQALQAKDTCQAQGRCWYLMLKRKYMGRFQLLFASKVDYHQVGFLNAIPVTLSSREQAQLNQPIHGEQCRCLNCLLVNRDTQFFGGEIIHIAS